MTSSYSKLLLITLLLVIILLGLIGFLYKTDLDLSEKIREQKAEIDYMSDQIQDLRFKIQVLSTKVDYLNKVLSEIIESQKLEIRTAYAASSNKEWTISLEGVNLGSMDVVIVEITLNGKPLSTYSSSAVIRVGSTSYTYSGGVSARIPVNQGFKVTIHVDGGFTSGQTIEIGLVSSSGIVFKRTVVLP